MTYIQLTATEGSESVDRQIAVGARLITRIRCPTRRSEGHALPRCAGDTEQCDNDRSQITNGRRLPRAMSVFLKLGTS